MKKLILTLILFAFLGNLFSQPWMQNIPENERNAKDINFYSFQKAFNEYWKDRKYERSNGIKPFRRWEEFMEPRVFPSGKLPKNQLWKEYQRSKSLNKKSKSTANWTHIGPTIAPTGMANDIPVGVGRINAIEFHPTDPNTIWIGAPSGGFWKTTDGGQNWYQTSDDLPIIGVSEITVDPTNPDIIYMATGDADGGDTYSIGLLKSSDGGETWNTTGLSYNVDDFIRIRGILVNPDTPNVVIVASWEGIFKSTNGAETFTNVFNNPSAGFIDLEYKPGDWSVIYAATYGYNAGGVYKSVDGGETFTQLTGVLPANDFIRVELAVTPANDQVIYAIYCNSYAGLKGVYKSTDEGEHWDEVISANGLNLLGWEVDGSDYGGQGTYDLSLAVSPIDENEIYVGGVNTWKSVDGGDNWTINAHWAGDQGAEYMHADQHIFTYSPEGILYSGNDGGIYKTLDGENWIDISNGINILQIYRIGTSATDETIAITGAQDNGSYLTRNNQWNAVVGGDGMECIIDYENPDIMYASAQFGALFKSEDGGYSFTYISPSGNGAWITPYIMHPTDHNTLYAGYDKVYKTTDRGESWESISGAIFGNNLRSLSIAPSDSNYLYAATYSIIYMTSDNGENWTEITTGLPSQSIMYSIVSQNNPETIWVTLSGYTENEKVYKSTDGGNSWINYSDGLPNIPANCVVYQNNTDDLLYVGTDLGVYYRDNNMTEWLEFNDDLPNVIVRELEIHYTTQRLRAATYGRGLWESPLYDDGTNAPTPSFTVNKNIACDVELIEFTDRSSYNPDSWEWAFEPNTISFVNGTDQNSQNPEVQFNSSGNYNVTLTSGNTNGSNSLTKNEFILQTDIKADFNTSASLSYPGGTVRLRDLSECDPQTWEWTFQPSSVTFIEETNVNSQNPVVQFNEIGEYSVVLIVTNDLGTDTKVKDGYITIGYNYSMNNAEITTCQGYFFDSKGPDHNYQDSENYIMTFIPNNEEAKLIFDFTEFKVEDHATCDYDYLKIYDGPSTESTLIGKYCGEDLPGEITSTDETGAITFEFYSDGGVTDQGWIATINCTSTSVFRLSNEQYTRIDIFPNPAKNIFNINIDGMISNYLDISIYDIDGKQIMKKNYKDISVNFSAQFDLTEFSKGIYIIEIKSEKKSISERIILE